MQQAATCCNMVPRVAARATCLGTQYRVVTRWNMLPHGATCCAKHYRVATGSRVSHHRVAARCNMRHCTEAPCCNRQRRVAARSSVVHTGSVVLQHAATVLHRCRGLGGLPVSAWREWGDGEGVTGCVPFGFAACRKQSRRARAGMCVRGCVRGCMRVRARV